MADILYDYRQIQSVLGSAGVHRPLIVCDKIVHKLFIEDYLLSIPDAVVFDGFSPNPLYDDVMVGRQMFLDNRCDGILSIGGGSAIDTAKCIKLYAKMPSGVLCLDQPYEDTGIFHLACPTTAGTGSEATRYAVIYYGGAKQSVTHPSIIPDAVVLEPRLLETLPLYQKKATMMDALCQAIESVWSVNSTEESWNYAREAIDLILTNIDRYLAGDNAVIRDMLTASHLAGKAINITQTTAAHAMSYKITSLCGLSHGHAVALCMTGVWPYMLRHPELCRDPRGSEQLDHAYALLAQLFDVDMVQDAVKVFREIYDSLELNTPEVTEEQLQTLIRSVNETRLKNHPVTLTEAAIEEIYRTILNG